ncbi:MAG: hypothetical protein Q4G47_02750 [Lachnospiraceae bacterium]|nr:hypothetical protein [Lachnospiraceae bacterium]
MLNREFTNREKILLVVCLLLALGLFYYQFVVKGIQQQIKDASTDQLETEIQTEQARSAKIAEMEQVIEQKGDKVYGDIAVYNNLAAEISYVGSILDGRATDVSLSWGYPVLNGITVRREVRISCTTASYDSAKSILKGFNECPFRCIIYDVTVADNTPATRTETTTNPDGTQSTVTVAQKTGIRDGSKLNMAFDITFFETIEGATTTEGLVIENSVDFDGSDGALAQRAHAYENS